MKGLDSALRAASLHVSGEHFERVRPVVERWLAGGRPHDFKSGDKVFASHSDEDDYFVVDGFLVGLMDDESTFPYIKSMIIEKKRPEDDASRLKLQDRMNVVACADSTLWKIPRRHHLDCLEDDSFARFMYMRRSFDFRISRNLLYVNLVSRSDEKVARMMIFLANFTGRRNEDDHIEISLDQHLLAGLCGLKRAHLNTLFKKWTEIGVISTKFKKVVVLDERELAAISKISFYQESPKIQTPEEWM